MARRRGGATESHLGRFRHADLSKLRYQVGSAFGTNGKVELLGLPELPAIYIRATNQGRSLDSNAPVSNFSFF